MRGSGGVLRGRKLGAQPGARLDRDAAGLLCLECQCVIYDGHCPCLGIVVLAGLMLQGLYTTELRLQSYSPRARCSRSLSGLAWHKVNAAGARGPSGYSEAS